MLREDLLSLPVGTRVLGEVERSTRLPGVVAKVHDGARLIRWDDGYSTIPLGMMREYDEYIAAHTELIKSREERVCRPETFGDVYQSKTQTEAHDLVAQDWDDVLDKDAVEVSHD